MFSTERDQLRNVFFESWRKHQQQLPIDPLEAQLIDIILLHPEYHAMLNQPEAYRAEDFMEANPFLHLSLHLAIREQISTDRPGGIQQLHQQLCVEHGDAHAAEHCMMDCLAEVLWQAQQNGRMPQEQDYLEKLRKNSMQKY